jgi:PAS domain S-box-containing protein
MSQSVPTRNPTPDQVTDAEWLIEQFMKQLPQVSITIQYDEEYSLIYDTQELSTFLGVSSSSLEKETINLKSLIHANDWQRVSKRLRSAIPAKPHVSILFRLSDNYDASKWVWLQAKAIFEGESNVSYFNGTLKEVTQQKGALDNLNKNEQFYEHILSTMPVQLVVFNEEHRYVFCNKTAISDDELRNWIIGKDDFEFCRYRGKDLNIAWERRYYFQEALSQQQEVKWEEEIWKDQQNKVVHLRHFTPIYDEAGEFQFVLGYGFDITDRKLAEERAAANENLLKSINANIQDGIYRYSPEKGFLYVNDAFLRIFEYQSLSQLNQAGDEFFKVDPEGRNVLTDIDGAQGSFNNREVPFLFNNQQGRFWGLVSCNKINDAQAGIVYDGVIADITEFKEAEELLKRTNEELRKKNSDLDRFIYSASHDLRAPLTSIQGVLQLAEMEEPDPTMQHYFNLIGTSVNKLENFVNDLIDYYRNAKTQQSYEWIDFENLVYATFEHFQYMEGADRVALTVENKMSEGFHSDKYRISIVLSNLLSNAVKYQDYSKPETHIKVTLAPCGDDACITITDNGTGIPEDKLEKVWEFFYRGEDKGQGTGMGLSIVNETVAKLGGSIQVDSEPGVGSTFQVRLPK